MGRLSMQLEVPVGAEYKFAGRRERSTVLRRGIHAFFRAQAGNYRP
jgi:hypothetical protein